MAVALNDRVGRLEGFLKASVGDNLVLLDMDKGVYVGLDAIGSRIWDRIESPVVVSEICEELGRDYAAEPAVIEADVLKFLNQLSDQKMIATA
jgi:hypothetical protein